MLLHNVVASFLSDKGYKGRSFSSPSLFTHLLDVPIFEIQDMPNVSKSSSKAKGRGKVSAPFNPSPSTSTSTSASTSHSSLSNALQSVRRLPRRASRLICGADPTLQGVHTPIDPPSTDNHDKEEEERAGLFRCSNSGKGRGLSSGTSSSSGAQSNGNSLNASSYTTTSSSSSSWSIVDLPGKKQVESKAWKPGPILSPEELAKALAKPSLLSSRPPESDLNPTSVEQKGTAAPKPKLDSAVKSRNYRELHLNNTRSVPSPVTEGSEPEISRPLSPPPDHFRRRERVLSACSASGLPASPCGSRLHPYTSPKHSPVTSPRSPNLKLGADGEDNESRGHPVRLHELLSSESLVAPRLKLYNGALEPDHNPSSPTSTKVQNRLSIEASSSPSRRRLRAQEASAHLKRELRDETHALRRVFSR